MESDYTQGSIFNFDLQELMIIAELKRLYVHHMQNWDLEGAYWNLRAMWIEFDAKPKDDERETLYNKMKTLENTRNQYLNGTKETGEYYHDLENMYRDICRTMKKHRLYFREGDDPTKSALKR